MCIRDRARASFTAKGTSQPEKETSMAPETLSVVDNRTGKGDERPIVDGAVQARDLGKIRTGPHDVGLLSYDPAFMNTASTRSAITFIDGDAGILRYRGYPIEQLAEQCDFLEVAFLLI